ncbi:MAG: uroporphyrinogen decarboxylase family protein [Gemmatimonadota bacterium]|nr:uroporphyrinogen decarboxylase family protein [Gemmatimonadota bacterium]
METSRELVIRAIRFESPGRLPYDFPPEYGSDFFWTDMTPSPDYRPPRGVDEWGAVWKNIGVCKLGEVERFPLKDWSSFDHLKIPDIHDPRRWEELPAAREKAGDRFLLGMGISIYERVHFIRGLENTWMDIFDAPVELCRLIDILVEMNLEAIERYSRAGVDGLFLIDDWGLQNHLMIQPDSWVEIWKPRYERIFRAAHQAGLFTFLHSCGYIVDILDHLIEAGLDVIQMDQQENMGLELLGERFSGRITFFSPVDIQATMAHGSPDEIRAYCRRMAACLGKPEGGFIPKWYSDPVGAGHSRDAIAAMCDEFLRI